MISPRFHSPCHTSQFLRDPAHPQIPARGLGYRIEVVRHGYKISDQIVMTDGRKVLAATSSVLWKLDYVIRAIRHVCFSKQSGIVALCHPSNDTGAFTDVKKIWSEISRFGKRRIHAGW